MSKCSENVNFCVKKKISFKNSLHIFDVLNIFDMRDYLMKVCQNDLLP